MTDPFSPEGPSIPGKVQKGKKGSKKGGVRTTRRHLDGDQQEEEHLDREHLDREHLDREHLAQEGGSIGKTWRLCEQPGAHTSFHSLLHVLVLKEVNQQWICPKSSNDFFSKNVK